MSTGYDKVLLSRLRRVIPTLLAQDICGVQPMSGQSNLIFGLQTRYGLWISNFPGCECEEAMNYTYDHIIDFSIDHPVVNDAERLREMLAWPLENCQSPYNYFRVAHSVTIPKETSEINWVWRWSFESEHEAFAFKIRWG